MAVPSNTIQTDTMIGLREDLADVIYNIDPSDTPLLSSVAHTKASGVFHEWQTDSLAAATNTPAIEGDDASADAFTASTRVGNYCQITRRIVQVSGTADVVDKAGRSSELSYQLVKNGKEMKRNMETALT